MRRTFITRTSAATKRQARASELEASQDAPSGDAAYNTAAGLRTGAAKQRWRAVLGLDFLMRNHAAIDCGGGWLCVRGAAPKATFRDAFRTTKLRSGYVEVAFSRTEALLLRCEGSLNGQPVQFLVDTGAYSSLLDIRAAMRVGLSGGYLPLGAKLVGFGGRSASGVYTSLVDACTIGGEPARLLSIDVADLSPWGVARKEVARPTVDGEALPPFDGFLGSDHLWQFSAVIAPGQSRMWLYKERLAS